ncbi:flagellar biosynthesis regulator FlaF [uncultured Marivita sp.]|uniref:flagellar biosynthesis regulator FlaF n=1 Tax=uncultured Marivita sp. TaxID=888080 RepID=UPI0026017717|nr:flagellar biosynthesis regulator FlaF [uncultured Marivita sp.]
MNAHNLAYQTYASASSTKSAKDTEIDIILRVTRELKTAGDDRKKNFAKFASALQTNRKLWVTLASDVANAQNQLPQDLRARLFYLAEFVQSYSSDVLKNDLGIAPLLDINLAVLRGLGTRAGEP